MTNKELQETDVFHEKNILFHIRQFKKAVTDAIMSRRAIRNMNTL